LDDQGRPIANPEQQPTLIFFYGNGMCIQYESGFIDYFRRMRMNVLAPDYPGYGMSDGRPTEKGLFATAEAAYAWVTNRPGTRRGQIIVSGFSLGTCPAIYLASRKPVARLVLFGAFTNAREMARAHTPSSLRWARWLIPAITVWRPINNLAKIRAVSCPILIVHGTRDSTAPIEMADRLSAAVLAKQTRLSIQGAEHDRVWEIGGAPLWEAIDGWMQDAPSAYLTLEADTFLLDLERKGQLPCQLGENRAIDGSLEGEESAAYPVSRTFKFQGPWANVTARINSLSAGGPVSIDVNNGLAGRDPAPNIVKQLRVAFRRDGCQQTAEAREGRTLVLPAGAEVLTALYGNLRGQSADGSICHYTVVRETDGAPWKLQKGWRTDANGRVTEEYPIP
jgi:hypothetical protein